MEEKTFIEQELFTAEDCDWLLAQAGEFEPSKVGYANSKEDAALRSAKINSKDRISEQCDMGQPKGELYDFLFNKLKPLNLINLDNSFIGFVRYHEGGFFTKHVDGPERAYTIIIQLSEENEYTGGDLVVLNQVVGKEKGNTVVFGTQVSHELKKVTSGTRNALVIWLDKSSTIDGVEYVNKSLL